MHIIENDLTNLCHTKNQLFQSSFIQKKEVSMEIEHVIPE